MFLYKFLIVSAISVILTLSKPSLASEVPLEQRNTMISHGSGFLLDYCDDDWNIFPSYWFYGKCGDTPEKRDWYHIDLTNCYTVTADGILAVDNWRHGGMDKKCERCQRCADLDYDACLQCRCNKKDGSKIWTKSDLDGSLFWAGERCGNRQKVCCGEWWGGPYCGEKGMPPEPSAPGVEYYLITEGVD